MVVVTWFPEELAADVLYDPRSFPDVPQNVSPDSIWLVDGNVDKNLLGTRLSKFETAHVLETVVSEDAWHGAAGWALPAPSETAALLAPSAPAGSPAGSAPPPGGRGGWTGSAVEREGRRGRAPREVQGQRSARREWNGRRRGRWEHRRD